MGYYKNAADGLKLMYIAQLGCIVCTVLAFIPFINVIAALVAIGFAVVSLLGMYNAGRDIAGCQKAFMITIASVAVSVLQLIFKFSIMNVVLVIIKDVLGFLAVYYVCTSVADVMAQFNAADVAGKGDMVWKINLACYAVSAVMSILMLIPFIAVLAIFVNIIIAVVQVIAAVIYMLFLKGSYEVLESRAM